MATSSPTRFSIDWRAAVLAGLFSGFVFLVLELIMLPVFMGTPVFAAPHMIAAILLGPEAALPPQDTLQPGIFLTALVVHFPLSIIYAIILGFIIHRMDMGMALAVGAVFGLALYFINFYGMTAVFPWFENGRNWVSIFAHIVFGLAAAWGYKTWARERAAVRSHGRV